MKKLKSVLLIIFSIILGLLLFFNLYNFFCIKILKQDFASVGGYTMLEVVSGSMEPTLHVGDLIIINTKEKEYHKDDIVTLRDSNGTFITHRIQKIENGKMVTKGDNNDSVDGEMNTSSIVGKYVTKINNGGRIIAAFKSPFTLIMILIVGILVCIFISTDKDGNPILDEDEKEFQEFLENKEKNKKEKEVKEKVDEVKEKKLKATTKKKTTSSNKKVTKKKTTKKSSKKKNSKK